MKLSKELEDARVTVRVHEGVEVWVADMVS